MANTLHCSPRTGVFLRQWSLPSEVCQTWPQLCVFSFLLSFVAVWQWGARIASKAVYQNHSRSLGPTLLISDLEVVPHPRVCASETVSLLVPVMCALLYVQKQA